MKETSEAGAATRIELEAYIDESDRLIVSFPDPRAGRIQLGPERGLRDLLGTHPDAAETTLAVRDFFQHGTVYEVYAAILDENGRSVASHWKPTGNGQQYTLAPMSESAATRLTLVIGALPRRTDAIVPAPLVVRSVPEPGPFPTSVDPPPQGAGGGRDG